MSSSVSSFLGPRGMVGAARLRAQVAQGEITTVRLLGTATRKPWPIDLRRGSVVLVTRA